MQGRQVPTDGRPTVILGLNYAFHDSSACVVRDGVLVCALEEERFSRRKHTSEFPLQSVRRCLQVAGLTSREVTHVAVSIRPQLHWARKAWYALRHLPRSTRLVRRELLSAFWQGRGLRDWYRSLWPVPGKGPELHFVPHHLAHAAGSFFVSPFESAAILSLDGWGEWSTSFLGWGKGTRIETLGESWFPHSLGSFYEAATEFCGFRPNYDEGKTMGLAPFGDPDAFYQAFSGMVSLDERCNLRIDPSWFGYQFGGDRRYSPKFEQHFGPPRASGAAFQDRHRDVAAAAQRVLEERGLAMARYLHERTRERHLVIAGGVALNSVMNGRILREGPFDDVYIMAAAGDNGTSIGAAYYLHHAILGRPRTHVHLSPYLGTSYGDADIKKILDGAKLTYRQHEDVAGVAAELLRARRVVGWFQGRMEIGPRALGARSILADPTDPGMKDRLNAEVKHREAFRPFAPSTTVEACNEHFDIGVEDPFMLKVCHVRPASRALLPAITHVDGTARLQTVRAEVNPLYHRLISRFGELSGVPVVLNTSFNVMGEPMVESPLDALRCFFTTGIDDLLIGSFQVSKR